jgi:hypothetical protein
VDNLIQGIDSYVLWGYSSICTKKPSDELDRIEMVRKIQENRAKN